jgi:hypothetical protein
MFDLTHTKNQFEKEIVLKNIQDVLEIHETAIPITFELKSKILKRVKVLKDVVKIDIHKRGHHSIVFWFKDEEQKAYDVLVKDIISLDEIKI